MSHVDGDHILGAVQLLADETLGATFKDVWFNGFRHLPGTVEPMGPVDGEELTFLLDRRTWNDAFDGKPVQIPEARQAAGEEAARRPHADACSRPTSSGSRTWSRCGRRRSGTRALVPGVGRKPTPMAPQGLEALGPGAIPDVAALAAGRVSEDTAEANGTSIVLLPSTRRGERAAVRRRVPDRGAAGREAAARRARRRPARGLGVQAPASRQPAQHPPRAAAEDRQPRVPVLVERQPHEAPRRGGGRPGAGHVRRPAPVVQLQDGVQRGLGPRRRQATASTTAPSTATARSSVPL